MDTLTSDHIRQPASLLQSKGLHWRDAFLVGTVAVLALVCLWMIVADALQLKQEQASVEAMIVQAESALVLSAKAHQVEQAQAAWLIALLGTSESAASVSKADDGYRTAAADFEYSLNGLANITGKDAWTQELIGILRRESASKAQLYQDIFELTQGADDPNSTQVRERLSKDGGRLSTSVSALVQTLSLNFSREAKRIQAENIQQAKALYGRLASLMVLALTLMTLLGWLLHRSRTIIHLEMDALQRQALTDPLTAMPNLRAFKEQLEKAMARSRRRTDALTLAMIDLDHFKAFNDQHGHPAGDRLLTLAASNWSALIPEHASLSRIGGEEFALILPSTNSFEAETLLKKLLIATPEKQSFSAGVSLYSHGENAESFIARADRALYRAKSEGRNRIAGEGSPTRISLAYVNA